MKNSNQTLINCVCLAVMLSTASGVILADPANDQHHDDHAKDDRASTATTVTHDKVETKDVNVHKNVSYTHDEKGWYDENHNRHDFETYSRAPRLLEIRGWQTCLVSIDLPFVHISL